MSTLMHPHLIPHPSSLILMFLALTLTLCPYPFPCPYFSRLFVLLLSRLFAFPSYRRIAPFTHSLSFYFFFALYLALDLWPPIITPSRLLTSRPFFFSPLAIVWHFAFLWPS